MAVIAINALNSNSGGGKSIRDSYLQLLNKSILHHKYIVIVSTRSGLGFITNPQIEVLNLPRFWSYTLLAPLVYRFALGQVLRHVCADLVFNIGDLIISTSVKQLYIFDWPYALNVHPKVWTDMYMLDRLNRSLKLWLIKRYFHIPDIVIAQTESIQYFLMERYDLNDVRVINNAVTINNNFSNNKLESLLPSGLRLLYPTVYYPHKNLEILLDLASLIKSEALDLRIIITINPISESSRRFLLSIIDHGLQDIIFNIGQVPLDQMADLYKQCNALLMPTLLESFSIVYLEAMHYGLPVLTSDMWFSRAVCGSAAEYFDPFEAADILRALKNVMFHAERNSELVNAGLSRVSSFPTWQENFATYQQYIDELLAP